MSETDSPIQALSIDRSSPIPPYQQLASGIYCTIILGHLSPNDSLPPIRRLAAHLRLNPNTVARAYAEVARRGVLTRRQGSGCRVARAPVQIHRKEALNLLRPRVEQLVSDGRMLGVEPEELARMIAPAPAGTKVPSSRMTSRPATAVKPANEPADRASRETPTDLWQPGAELID